MQLQGWGRYPVQEGTLTEPDNTDALRQLLTGQKSTVPLIARGAGRSYGDSAIAANVVGTRYFDNFHSFDQTSGVLRCDAGVSLEQILQLTIPAGWFLPVVPGTSQITVAGAIASDVHGKNHHRDGCFSSFVNEFSLLLANGETVRVSRDQNRDLFRATCGGMGLTGIILEASLQLRAITSSAIQQRTRPAESLSAIMALFEEYDDAHYSVAWLDCLAAGQALGRSILFLGEHADDNQRGLVSPRSWSVPFSTPGALLNSFTVRSFNAAYFNWHQRRSRRQRVSYANYFFPLDSFHHWNRLYGRRGFLQYQLVLPAESAKSGIQTVLQKIQAAGKGSFLSVLKKMGAQNDNLLSFPLSGYTLALDFKYEPNLFQLLETLDAVVLDHDGRLYLAKDARMSEHVFKKSYPRWQEFLEIKKSVDPQGQFASAQSMRLGIKF